MDDESRRSLSLRDSCGPSLSRTEHVAMRAPRARREHALGLQRRRSIAAVILPAVGTLVVGAAIGSALGMLFGPRYGYQLMDRMGVKIPEGLREAATGTTSTGETTRAANPNNAAVSSL